MKLPLSVLDRDVFYTEIINLLNDKDCFIIIDTNILASFFRLHEKARNELIGWMDSYINAKRLKTPAWALNEYTKKFVRGNLSEYLSNRNKLATIGSDFKEARKFLSLHIDPSSLPPGIYNDGSDYLEDLDFVGKAINRLHNLVKTTGEKYINAINEMLKEKFDSTALDSDIFALADKVSISGPIRFLNELPPGYEDKRKDFNPYGDLIIWEEILGFIKKQETQKKVIFLTNDIKRDWMYIPRRIKIRNIESANKDNFKIVDPRLVFQFNLASGTDDFHIVNLETLTHILIDSGNNQLFQLAKALQIERIEDEMDAKKKIDGGGKENVDTMMIDVNSKSPEAPTDEELEDIESKNVQIPDDILEEQSLEYELLEDDTETVTEAIEPAGIELGIYKREALADKGYGTFVSSQIGSIVAGLRSYNWYTQNSAIEQIKQIFDRPSNSKFSPDDLFVLGRNIYQVAAGGAYAAIQYIEDSSINSIGNDFIKEHLLAGMLYEIFFNSSGLLRRPDYKIAFIDEVFSELSKPVYTPVVTFINKTLKPFEGALLTLPSANPKVFDFQVTLSTELENVFGDNVDVEIVEGITLNGEPLLRDNNGAVSHSIPTYLNEKDIINEIKRAFALSSSQIKIQFNPEMRQLIVISRHNTILWRGELPPSSNNEQDLEF